MVYRDIDYWYQNKSGKSHFTKNLFRIRVDETLQFIDLSVNLEAVYNFLYYRVLSKQLLHIYINYTNITQNSHNILSYIPFWPSTWLGCRKLVINKQTHIQKKLKKILFACQINKTLWCNRMGGGVSKPDWNYYYKTDTFVSYNKIVFYMPWKF